MLAALLAFLLLAATVDPRPPEPLRLLAEVGAHDMTDGHLGLRPLGTHEIADAEPFPTAAGADERVPIVRQTARVARSKRVE